MGTRTPIISVPYTKCNQTSDFPISGDCEKGTQVILTEMDNGLSANPSLAELFKASTGHETMTSDAGVIHLSHKNGEDDAIVQDIQYATSFPVQVKNKMLFLFNYFILVMQALEKPTAPTIIAVVPCAFAVMPFAKIKCKLCCSYNCINIPVFPTHKHFPSAPPASYLCLTVVYSFFSSLQLKYVSKRTIINFIRSPQLAIFQVSKVVTHSLLMSQNLKF